MTTTTTHTRKSSPTAPELFPAESVATLGAELRALLADVFALYLKTKGFHWHVAGPHFRDHHLLLDEQAGELFAMTDALAERGRKLGAHTLRSIGDVARHQRLVDCDLADLGAADMLRELLGDNLRLAASLRAAHELFDAHGDVASASLVETWLDETERRAWFLREVLAQPG